MAEEQTRKMLARPRREPRTLRQAIVRPTGAGHNRRHLTATAKIMKSKTAFSLALMLGAITGIQPLAALAHQPHADNAAAHEHGAARLNVALDGQVLFMELMVPAHDIVGFEHRPTNDQQRAAVTEAIKQLSGSEALLALPERAGCRLETAEVRTPLASNGYGHQSEDDAGHDKDAHAAAEHHAQRHEHDDHAHEHHSHDHHAHDAHAHAQNDHQAAHAEFHVFRQYRCRAPQAIDIIRFTGFARYPSLDRVQLQMIGPGGQSGAVLRPRQPEFRP
ncbi:MAG: DUF2796 domain-containing protein [Halothiobacillaceae bacterium]